MEPEDAWSKFEEHLAVASRSYISGCFEAKPRSARAEDECSSCRAADLCGFRRKVQDGLANGEENS